MSTISNIKEGGFFMLFKTHLLGGITSGLVTAIALESNDSFSTSPIISTSVVMVTAMLGSGIPDIDKSNSTFGRKVKPLSFLIEKFFSHRGFTHSLSFIALLSFIVYLISSRLFTNNEISIFLVLGLSVGMLSHLILDALTKEGIPFFHPFWKKKFSLKLMITGGLFEKFFAFGLIGLNFLLIIFYIKLLI